MPKENADDGVDPPNAGLGAEDVEVLLKPKEKADFGASEDEAEVTGGLKPAKLDGGAGIEGVAEVDDENELSP